MPNKLAFIDVETTGTSPVYDRIIEVAVLRVENGKLVDKFVSLVNPGSFVPPEITSLTGISSDMLENAPAFNSIKTDLGEILADAVFVAHNVRFDYGFIRNEFRRQEITFKAQQFCTCKLSRMLFPRYKRHNLDTVIERHHLDCKNRHRAEGDTYAIYNFYQKIIKEFSEKKLEPVFQKILKKPSIPVNLSAEILDNLPECPGVYIFYGETGAPLYIGKSVNIRDRVLSHFSSDVRAAFEMKISREIKSIETISAAGELDALITESQLVKKLLPLYNRQLRHAKQMVILKQGENRKGFKTINIETVKSLETKDLSSVVGVFRSQRQAKEALVALCKDNNLCTKLVGLEKGKGNCFNFGLGRCFGACIGLENYLKYNIRFVKAFSPYKIKSWPFPSAIFVTETGEDKKTIHIVDKWCYLGKIIKSSDLENFSSGKDLVFDYDIYKILNRFLLNPKNQKKIKIYNKVFPNHQKMEFL